MQIGMLDGGWKSLLVYCPQCGQWVPMRNPDPANRLLPEPPPGGYQIPAHDRITGNRESITVRCLAQETAADGAPTGAAGGDSAGTCSQ